LVALQVSCKLMFANDAGWSGFSPFLAIAVFSGFIVKEKNMSFLFPLLALFISDALIHFLYLNDMFGFEGFYAGQWKNYLLLLAITFIGWALKGKSYSTLAVGALAGPSLFFLVSNFMVWQANTEIVYAKSFRGLMICYEAGLPFYRNSLIATLLFLPVILIVYNYLTKKKAVLILA
ncbi:MAG TPA: DUF6580 family putative transport protein, partial [Chitinophagaceae bacterium]|nr:DUF6580 family putative transport protein [Chitinophagaceae bacterium]